MAEEVGKGVVKIEADAKGLGKDINKQVDAEGKAVADSGKKMGVGFGTAFKAGAAVAIAAGVAFAASAVGAASDLGESVNAVNVTFGEAAAGIHQLGEDAATAVGLSNNEFNSLAVKFSSFADTVAGEGGDVVDVMADMTGRAADFASVMNLDVADAAAIFQSGLAGESEPLKQYGIDLSAAAVEAFAVANGIAEAGVAMTEAQKVQARYGLLMEKTSKTAGDFANTSDGLANRQRIMAAQFENVKAKIGAALIPAMSAVVGIITDKVIPAFITIRDVLATVFAWINDNKAIVIAAFTGVAVAVAVVLVPAFIAWAATAGAAAIATITAAAPAIALGVAVAALAAGIVWLYQNVDIFRTSIDAVKDFIVNQLVPAFQAIYSFIADNVIPIIVKVIEYALKPFILEFKLIKAIITDVVIPAFTAIVSFVRDQVIPIFVAIATAIGETATAVSNKVGEIVGFVTAIPGKLLHLTATLFAPIKNAIDATKNWVSDRLDDIVQFAKDLPGRMAGLFGGMWDGIKNAFKAAINWVIDRWNGLEFSIPGIDPPGPGSIPGFTIGFPNVPRLAAGGTFTVPTLAVIGEGRHAEVASPEPLMRQIVREEAGRGGWPDTVTLIVEGEPITARILRRERDVTAQLRAGKR